MGIDIQYLYPHWGSESLSCSDFISRVLESGFGGIEINLPYEAPFLESFPLEIEKAKQQNGFRFIAQQVLDLRKESSGEYLNRVLNRLDECASFQPDAINSHTGKDHYSFDDNCRIIESIENFSIKSGIPVYHEIHRGRFSFHSSTILFYLRKFPNLKLVGDFSHWCVVSESLLQDQVEILEQVYPHIHHIHARIGTEQASQITGPFAPEWKIHLETFFSFWNRMVEVAKIGGRDSITITPEFGPFPYMPEIPYSRQPFYNQHEINLKIMELLKHEFSN